MAKQGSTGPNVLNIGSVTTDRQEFTLLGLSPLILNKLSKKAQEELLYPPGKLKASEKIHHLKHDPLSEFRASAHTLEEDDAPTLLAMPATAIKGSMREAALRIPGSSKTEIGQLTFIQAPYISVFGEPQLLMSMVRSADMNRTPDVRTRCIVPEWTMRVTINYVVPNLNTNSIINLLAAAGIIIGIGDWRPQKGSGSYGQFRVVDGDKEGMATAKSLMSKWGRKAQQAAMTRAQPHDTETDELLSWFQKEHGRRAELRSVK